MQMIKTVMLFFTNPRRLVVQTPLCQERFLDVQRRITRERVRERVPTACSSSSFQISEFGLDEEAKAGAFAYGAGKGWSLRLLRSVSADYTCGAGELSGPAAERWSARTVSLLTRRSSTSS